VQHENEARRAGVIVARGLLAKGFVQAKVPEAQIAARISEIIAKSFADEAALEAEAEDLARQHARQTLGMDQGRIIRGIMERLAKERNFPL
jgi:hypothetical protein